MNYYRFIVKDDDFGDYSELFLSDFLPNEITLLWNMTEGKSYRERIAYISENAKLLNKRFELINETNTFYM